MTPPRNAMSAPERICRNRSATAAVRGESRIDHDHLGVALPLASMDHLKPQG